MTFWKIIISRWDCKHAECDPMTCRSQTRRTVVTHDPQQAIKELSRGQLTFDEAK